MKDFNFGDYPVANINETHMLVPIICDISGSMDGKPIQNLNAAVNHFKQVICKDPKAADLVDVLVIGFNHQANVVQDWVPVSRMEEVNFTAGGGTDISSALEKAVEMTRQKTKEYTSIGVDVKVPWFILVSDGKGGDVSAVAEVIRKRTEEHKMKLFVLAAPGYDEKTIAQLTGGNRVLELVDNGSYDFMEFFDFAAVSIKAASTSAPGEKINITSNIGSREQGSNYKVPDLDKWLND